MCITPNMIIAMPLKPSLNLGIISVYKMKIHWAVAKLVYFSYFVDVWDGPLSTTRALTTYSDNIYDRLPTTFIVIQHIIKVIGNQIASASLPLLEVSSGLEFYCLKHYYVPFNVHDLNPTFMKEMFNTTEISYDLRKKYIMHLPRFNKIAHEKNTFK